MVLLELVERLGNLMRTELRKAGADESAAAGPPPGADLPRKANRYSNTPQALADYLGLTKGTVSQTLLLLDRRGLIERFEDDIDRRVVRLRLSAAGEQFLYESQPASRGRTPPATSAPTASATPSRRCARRSPLQEDNEGAPSAPATAAASASGCRSALSRAA